jgi:hypothetical protein
MPTHSKTAPGRGGIGHHDLARTEQTGPGDGGQTDRSRAHHGHPGAWFEPGGVDRVQADRQGLDERGGVVGRQVGHGEGLAPADPDELGEGAGAPAHADEVGRGAPRHVAEDTRPAPAAPEHRERRGVPPHLPVTGEVAADGNDLTAELMAHDCAAGQAVHRFEIAAADAAGGHLEHQIARSWRGIGQLDNVEALLIGDDGGFHADRSP